MNIENKEVPKWKIFEELVATIQKSLAPNAKVTHNEFITGKSGVKRQLDVTVRCNIGQFSILAVIDCKDWRRPVNIANVGSFADTLEDVSANKGAIVCNAGFTAGAKKRATEKGIDLLRAVDTASVDWKVQLAASALCDFRHMKGGSFTFKHSSPTPFQIPPCDFRYLEIYKQDKSFNDILINLLYKAWNVGKLPTEIGNHEDLEFINEASYTKVDGIYYGPVNILANITVERELFFGQVHIYDSKGFMNDLTGGFTSKSFRLGINTAAEVEEKWQKINNESDLAVKPTCELYAHDCFPILEYKKDL